MTTLSWFFIVLGFLFTIIGALQFFILNSDSKPEGIGAQEKARLAEQLPGLGPLVVEHMQVLLLGLVAVSLLALVAGLGLRRRRQWARVIVIGLFALAAVVTIIGVFVFQRSLGVSFNRTFRGPIAADSAWRRTAEQAISTFAGMRVLLVVSLLPIAGFFGWLGAKLMSPATWAVNADGTGV